MEPLTALIVSSITFVVLLIISSANLVLMSQNFFKSNHIEDDKFKSFGLNVAIHIILNGLTSLAFLAILVCGIVWLTSN